MYFWRINFIITCLWQIKYDDDDDVVITCTRTCWWFQDDGRMNDVCSDLSQVGSLMVRLYDELLQRGQWTLFDQLEAPLSVILALLELRGLHVNVDVMHQSRDTLQVKCCTMQSRDALQVKWTNLMLSFLVLQSTLCAKNETHVILNISYSCKSIAMKFSSWYPDGLSY